MGREYRWDLVLDGIPVTVTCEQKGNKYVLYLDDDHLNNIYRLPKKQMPYGLKSSVSLRGIGMAVRILNSWLRH